MQKELAVILRDKIKELPFVDVLAGLVLTQSIEEVRDSEGGAGFPVTFRYPVSSDVLQPEACESRELALVPDSGRKSIIYFEDFGITSTGGPKSGFTQYNSSLRLVCWMNRANLVADAYQHVSGPAIAMIVQRLAHKNPQSIGIFTRLTIEVARIPEQSASLFGRYNYRETDRQYLRPPFEFFGIDFTCRYQISARCLDEINWNQKSCY